MKSEFEIKCLRCGKGFFKVKDMVDAMKERGHEITQQAYKNKEKGVSAFSALEIKLMSEILNISLEEAYEYFL